MRNENVSFCCTKIQQLILPVTFANNESLHQLKRIFNLIAATITTYENLEEKPLEALAIELLINFKIEGNY